MPPAASNDALEGEREKVQDAAALWVTVNVWPAMDNAAVRDGEPVLAATA
jgi:hypothetical protein